VSRFCFVEDHRDVYDVKRLCAPAGVSRSGFYAWRTRPASARAGADAALLDRITTIHTESRRTYGAPRVHGQLARSGIQVGCKRVARLMRSNGLVGVNPRRKWRRGRLDSAPAPDLLQRDFTAERPNRRWVADITVSGAAAVAASQLDAEAFQAACVEGFVASWSARGFSPVTIENAVGVLDRFFEMLGKPAWEAGADDVDRIVAELVGRGMAASTRRGYVQAFKDFHRFLVARKASEIEATFLRLGPPSPHRPDRPHPVSCPKPQRGFRGRTLDIAEQRRLFRRWTSGDVHPHEAVVGVLALLHAFTNAELRSLRVTDLDRVQRCLRVERRPHPVPLDPVSFAAVENCLAHRAALRTRNPHVIVTQVTKPRATPASSAYLTTSSTTPK
jgi:transposase InsO family protein